MLDQLIMLKIIKKHVSKPSFVSQKVFNKDLVAIHDIKPVLTLDELIYLGFSVLDLRILLMYDFHQNYIKIKYDAELLLTDTNSLTYEITTFDIYEDFYEDKNLFDFSDYPRNSKIFDTVNKNCFGKMKYELKGKIINEFVGLKPKMYFLFNVDGKKTNKQKTKKAKEVNKNIV